MSNIYKSKSSYLFPIIIGLGIIFATVIVYVQISNYEQQLSQSHKTELTRIIEGIIDRRESRLQTISYGMIGLFENSNEVTHDEFTHFSNKLFSSNKELVSIVVIDENQVMLYSFPQLDMLGKKFNILFPTHPTQLNGINTMNLEFPMDDHRKLIISVPFDYFISYNFIPRQDFKLVLFSPLDNNLKLYQVYNTNGITKTDNVEFTPNELENILKINIHTNLYGHTIQKNYVLKYEIWDKNFEPNNPFNSLLLIIGTIASGITPFVIYKTNNVLRQKNVELKQIKKSKDEFITMISHELKTPLTPIKGYVELLLSKRAGPLTDTQKHYLEIITSDTISLQKLISDLMDVQKLELGILKLNLHPENISDIINNIVEQIKPVLIKHNITITTDLSDTTRCICDKIRIGQVLNNLLNNAMDFIPQNNGKIKIRTTSEQNFVKITIEDNGIGMPPDKIKHIFTKFYQIDTSITREHRGTGLGLAICQGIIESHGGRIWGESEGTGQGSKFIFLLPS